MLPYDHGGNPSCAPEEPVRLVDLLAAGDADHACQLMRRHLTANQGRVRDAAEDGR